MEDCWGRDIRPDDFIVFSRGSDDHDSALGFATVVDVIDYVTPYLQVIDDGDDKVYNLFGVWELQILILQRHGKEMVTGEISSRS